MPKKIFIKTKKFRVYLHAAFALCIFLISIFLCFHEISEDLFTKILCIAAAGISGIFLLTLIPIIKINTGIIIEDTGITDCTKFSKIGPIPWHDILFFEKEEIKTEICHKGKKTGKSISRTYIAAKIKTESPFGEILAGINMNIMPGGGGREIIEKLGRQTLIINAEMLDCSADILFETLRQIHKENSEQ